MMELIRGVDQVERYSIITEKLFNEDFGEYISYGISFVCQNGDYGKISDLSLNKNLVENFCRLLNTSGVKPTELEEYIEDFLASPEL